MSAQGKAMKTRNSGEMNFKSTVNSPEEAQGKTIIITLFPSQLSEHRFLITGLAAGRGGYAAA